MSHRASGRRVEQTPAAKRFRPRGCAATGSAMVGTSRHRSGAADGGPGHHHREHRPAVGSRRTRIRHCEPAVGDHGLFAGIRQPAAARGPVVRPSGCASHPDHRADRVRRGVCSRRGRRRVRDPDRGPGGPRRLRRHPRACRAVHPEHHVHRPRRPREGVRRLLGNRSQRCGTRTATRRRGDGVAVVAMVPLHQHGVRAARRARRTPLRESGPKADAGSGSTGQVQSPQAEGCSVWSTDYRPPSPTVGARR